MNNYELVVGLETHAELQTKTKIFCGCPNKFGKEPNTNCCPVCVGLPGTLPVLNKKAVEFAVRAGLALGCKINLTSKMDRKNYTYPDLPKAYQISQFEAPICSGGGVELSNGRKIRINHIHIEEDAGKLVHKQGDVYVDYNRGGVPLIEIVSEPDIHSAEEAKEYVEKIQMVLRYTGVSNCKMQEGSMRCDVNVSVKPKGTEKLGTRTEIKNMNSLTFMMKAIDYEFGRHIKILESGGKITQETLRYLEETASTEPMRNKEDAQDYRYFRDPDLVKIILSEEKIEKIKKSLPELPDSRFKRYTEKFGISGKDALVLIKYKNTSDYFEKASDGLKNPKSVANFILGQIFSKLETETEKENFEIKLPPKNLKELALLLESGKINMNLAKTVLPKMLESGGKAEDFLTKSDLEGIGEEELLKICENAVKNNEPAVKDYLSGKEKALGAILGAVMKETKGKANAISAEKIILEIIKG